MPPQTGTSADAMYNIKSWPVMRTPPFHLTLCKQCEEISKPARGSSKSYTLYSDKKPWEPNCYGCWIYEGFTKATAKSRKQEVETVSLDVENEWSFRLTFRNDVDWDEYWIYNGLDSPYSVKVLAYPEPALDSMDQESAVSYARDCLRSCRDLHKETCGLPYRDPDLPTRVLCVGNDNDGVFLHVQGPTAYPSSARYACLSHCWGDSQPLRTLKSNLKAHLENISWNQIPKTFQDAIAFARELGVHYIWIDSLCIVQDDADDWLAESAKMADIYQNGYITIAASAGRGSRDGLYHNPGNTNIVFGTIHGNPVGVGLRRAAKHPVYRGTSATPFEDANADFPFFTRAWVFQERMLSARVLHFGTHEMFWECRTEGVCACNGHRIPMFSDSELLTNQFLSSKSGLDRMGRTSVDGHAALWRDLVEEYSQLRLTKSSDKLPAIEGLAAVMKPMRWTEDYVAGMWTMTPMDLLWTAKTERDYTNEDTPITTYPRAGYRTQRWRAPSWSWASVDADIIWTLSSKAGPGTFDDEDSFSHKLHFEAEYMLDRLDERIKNGSQGKQGKHDKPTLKLTGQVEPATLCVDIPGKGKDTWLHIKNKLGEELWSSVPAYSEGGWEEGYNYVQLDDPEDLVKLRRGSVKMQVTCMRMAALTRSKRLGHPTSANFEYVLILIETAPGGREYRRVGVAIRVVGWSGFRNNFNDPWDFRTPDWEERPLEEEVAPKKTLLIV